MSINYNLVYIFLNKVLKHQLRNAMSYMSINKNYKFFIRKI